MSDFWRNVIIMALKVVLKAIEALTGTDLDGDEKAGF